MHQREPMTALAAARLTLVQPHPGDAGGILLTDAANKTRIERRWDFVWLSFGARAALDYFEVEGVVIASEFCKQLTLFQASSVLNGIAHCGPCGETSGGGEHVPSGSRQGHFSV